MKLADVAVRRPVTTAMFFTALSLLGIISWGRLPVQIFPELIFPEVFISLSLPGASPEQIERDLVLPAEEEIGKLEGIEQIESAAMAGLGAIRVSYSQGTDMKFALLELQGRMNRLQPLFPERTGTQVRRFDAADFSSVMMELHVLGEWDLNALRDFSEEKIRPELEAVDGVVNAQVMGGRRSAVEVILNPALLQAYGLSVGQVRNRLNAVNQRRQYLGRVYDSGRAYPVSLQGQFEGLHEVRNTTIQPDIPLRLDDIAQVRDGLQEQTDRHRINGKPAVGIRIQKDDEANLIAVAGEVKKTIERLNREFADLGLELGVSSSQAELMNEALDTLKQAAVIGALLGLFVLFLFLRNLRFVSVLLLAIPVSLLITFNLMYAWGLSINVLSLCGLALAVGMLTDNGIVVMESIFKQYERGKTPAQAARDGTAEVSRAVVAATGTTVAVFLPVVFVQSDAQDLLFELALSMVFPLLASLLVALTLVPSLAARGLQRDRGHSPGAGRLMEQYTIVLKACLRHRVQVVLGVGIAVVGTLVLAFFYLLQQEVRREETRFTVYVDLPEGATLDATDAVVKQAEAAARDLPGIERFTTTVEAAHARIAVLLKDRSERPNQIPLDEIKEKLDQDTQTIQGGVIGYEPQPRAGGAGGGRGFRRPQSGGFNLTGGQLADQAVVRGYDFATLQMIADDLVFRLQELEEVDTRSVRPDAERGAPEVQVLPDAVAMFDRRLQSQDILAAVGDARWDGFQTSVPFLLPDATEVPVVVRTTENPEDEGPGLLAFRQTPIQTPSGNYVGLNEVARVRTDEGRSSILRTDLSRRIVVSYRLVDEVLDSQPRLDAARKTVRATLGDMVLPQGYSVELTEATEDTIYYWMMGIAAVLIYMILASLFESLSAPVMILCTLPPAIFGSCWALMLSQTGLSQQEGPMALLGFIVLLGIAVNNGIILIDAIGTLRTRSGFRMERAVLAAGRSRVRPILMTSGTTLLGVLPLALKFGGDYEIWPPFAITVLGGLSVSMLSTLIFIPVVYMGLDQARRWLKEIGPVGILFSGMVSGVAAYGIYVRYESIFWASLCLLPVWFVLLGAVWMVQRVGRARTDVRESVGPVDRIQIRNLTKLYGAPGRFRREWARYDRRAERQGGPVEKKSLRESLAWKLPLMGLLVYLGFYFEEGVWMYLHGLVTAFFLIHLGRCLASLWSWKIPPQARFLGKMVLPALFLAYLHVRLNLLSITMATGAAWMCYRLIRYLAERIETGRVKPEDMEGRTAWVRRLVYRSAASVPGLGVRAPEFQALIGVDLEIGRGMFGLLGPNGAGKTTLMRILCRVLEPTCGSVQVNGKNLLDDVRAQGLIGYLPQHFGQYGHLSAFEFLEYRALLEGLNAPIERHRRIMECLEMVNLVDRKDDPVGS
ncbi:MAG: efflux RND transporter permease subunit, partial [bacterium]|nr:efflux RND transporter permease subunit [bacterium]